MDPTNDMDNVAQWAEHATILQLRAMVDICTEALRDREFVCRVCGETIPTALPLRHPTHKQDCLRYASMVSY